MQPNKYKKRPVVVSAVKTTYYYDDACFEKFRGNIQEVLDWVNQNGGVATEEHDPSGDFGIEIDTLEGTMYVAPGDYVIQGVEGEFYPCKPAIFEKTYDKVEEEEPLPGQHNCANCGMSYEDCFKKVVANQYLPAAEQPCCINCLYMFTHSGKPEMAEPDTKEDSQ